MKTVQILNYGGGRQTVAECVLIKKGKLERPDRIVIANTGREKRSTWDYAQEVTNPLLASIGLTIEIAPRSLAYVDLYGLNGDLLLPVFTPTGKLSAFCSDEWKGQVVKRYLHLLALGYTQAEIAVMSESKVREEMKRRIDDQFVNWIGFAWDERKRIKGTDGRRFPLCDLMLTKADCIKIILDAGLPLPPPSSCWMCPNSQMKNGDTSGTITQVTLLRLANWMTNYVPGILSKAMAGYGFTGAGYPWLLQTWMLMTAMSRADNAVLAYV